MMCDFQIVSRDIADGRQPWECPHCKTRLNVPVGNQIKPAKCPSGRGIPAVSPNGPGTALKAVLSELGIKPTASCGCDAMVAKMNQWGPDGCEANRDEILAHLQTAYDSADLATKLRAGANAIAQGKPLTLAGLLDLALERSKP